MLEIYLDEKFHLSSEIQVVEVEKPSIFGDFPQSPTVIYEYIYLYIYPYIWRKFWNHLKKIYILILFGFNTKFFACGGQKDIYTNRYIWGWFLRKVAEGGVIGLRCHTFFVKVGIHSKTCSVDRKSHGAFVKKKSRPKIRSDAKVRAIFRNKSPPILELSWFC